MTRDEAKTLVLSKVEEIQGCKATVLAVTIASTSEQMESLLPYPLPELIEELIEEGRLIEIEYALPTMSYRIKSFLLPEGSLVRIRGAK